MRQSDWQQNMLMCIQEKPAEDKKVLLLLYGLWQKTGRKSLLKYLSYFGTINNKYNFLCVKEEKRDG